MPIVLGVGVSYSPLLYRRRSEWPAISRFLVGDVTQPQSRELETDDLLSDYEGRIGASLELAMEAIARSRLDALIVLTADRGEQFDASNVPQVHIQVGGEVWADLAFRELGEPSRILRFTCQEAVAELLAEELVRCGFDISEGRKAFKPLGEAGRGIGLAASAAIERLAPDVPIIPIAVNCHVQPVVTGARSHAFGTALAQNCDLTHKRIGILVSGGLSGDPRGMMAGWIDEVLDKWVLLRITRGQSDAIAQIWGARSRTLKGSSAEIRLWMVGASALEHAGCQPRVIDYMAIHHAAAGVAFVTWEQAPCR